MNNGTPLYAGEAAPAQLKGTSPGRMKVWAPRDSRAFIYWSMASTTLCLFALVAVMLRVGNLSLPWSWVSMMATGTVPLLLSVGYCHARKFYKLRDGLLIVVWAGVLSQLLIFPMYGAARLHFPLRDAALARIDHALGIGTLPLLNWLSHHAGIQAVLAKSYDALFPMMLAAAILPAMTGRLARAREYVIGNLFSVLTAVPVFAVLPAVGPWIPYHLHPSLVQAQCAQTLQILRQSGMFRIDPYYMAGLICFPSFHVILAVLSTYALWSIRPLRAVALVLCVTISFSALSTGWHYSIDVLGGLAFAAMSIAAARTFTEACKRLDDPNRVPAGPRRLI